MKEAWVDFENRRKSFLGLKNLYVPDFGTLPQCIWSGFQNEKLMKMQQMMIPRMIMKGAWEDFENRRKRFLDPENLYVPDFGTLPQCIWSGFQNERERS